MTRVIATIAPVVGIEECVECKGMFITRIVVVRGEPIHPKCIGWRRVRERWQARTAAWNAAVHHFEACS